VYTEDAASTKLGLGANQTHLHQPWNQTAHQSCNPTRTLALILQQSLHI